MDSFNMKRARLLDGVLKGFILLIINPATTLKNGEYYPQVTEEETEVQNN